ncbi:MAG: hypothetical protein GY719_20950 [bacterium]|nr:hypothetical protein [bacterium]
MQKCALPVFLICLLALTVPAHAVTFSFASDDNHDGPTFNGHSGGSMPDDLNEASAFSVDGVVNVDLMVDLNDDAPGGIVIFPAEFFFAGSISNYTPSARGANWVQTWDVDGVATFRHAGTGQNLLQITFDGALLTSLSPSLGTLGETATLQDSEGVDPTIRFRTFPLLQGIGVNDGAVALSEDFAFTMTRIRRTDTNGLPFLDHGLFLRSWISEGSFSAHATAGFVVEEF